MSYRQRGRSYRQRGNNRQLSYSRQRTNHPKPEPLPAWEKTFCIEVGAMPWERFVKAKKNLISCQVMQQICILTMSTGILKLIQNFTLK
ncbi:hypothetical protein Golob_003530 [Gossypium lobatum]|uniref:Uncharacterized protein n=1 Tax=Gossypium lobatum TaxID=34289 RepID=A0A7J8MYP6_9ROSI|nr:hypothetical protein [Gossypium lobatum]